MSDTPDEFDRQYQQLIPKHKTELAIAGSVCMCGNCWDCYVYNRLRLELYGE